MGISEAQTKEYPSDPPTWDEEKLDEVQAYSRRIGSTSFLLTTRGEVIRSWGDPETLYETHSVRKALLSALVGQHVGDGPGEINLERTLEELGIDDHPNPLTALQRQATVLHLVKSISGINHNAAAETGGMREERDQLLGNTPNQPGMLWAYNNWDYNALTTIFEQETGLTVYEAFKAGIADPLGMQDFDESCVDYVKDSSVSEHAKAGFRMSARDLVKVGLLYLNRGRWNDRHIISSSWVERITEDYVETGRAGVRSGHGYLWWVPCDSTSRSLGIPKGTFLATGFAGQRVVVIPAWQTVVIHQVNTENYDECFATWAEENGHPFVSIGDADGKTQEAFMIYLLRCILPERADCEVCRKCRFVSGKFFDRLLAKIIEAHE